MTSVSETGQCPTEDYSDLGSVPVPLSVPFMEALRDQHTPRWGHDMQTQLGSLLRDP